MRSFFRRFASTHADHPPNAAKDAPFSRRDFLLKGISKDDRGLEIAPFFRPIVSKAEGYGVETIDVLTTEELREKLLNDPTLPDHFVDQIELVDHIGSASEIKKVIQDECEESYDYILSSHNFEHLPNPLRFLKDCEELLSVDGQLCMAIPDLRCCFDRFRMPTELDVWLKSFYENKPEPSPYDRFRAWYKRCNNIDRLEHGVSDIILHPNPLRTLQTAHAELCQGLADQNRPYQDCHVSAFTPTSFRLLIKECNALGLIRLDVVEFAPTVGNEFLVRLKKVMPATPFTSEQRRDLYFEMLAELNSGVASSLSSHSLQAAC